MNQNANLKRNLMMTFLYSFKVRSCAFVLARSGGNALRTSSAAASAAPLALAEQWKKASDAACRCSSL